MDMMMKMCWRRSENPGQMYFLWQRELRCRVGGALDVCSGSVRRAPDLVQRAGLEWLYRMLSEPKRFAQIPELIEFRRLVNAEKKQNFRKIDGGRVWKAKKLQ